MLTTSTSDDLSKTNNKSKSSKSSKSSASTVTAVAAAAVAAAGSGSPKNAFSNSFSNPPPISNKATSSSSSSSSFSSPHTTNNTTATSSSTATAGVGGGGGGDAVFTTSGVGVAAAASSSSSCSSSNSPFFFNNQASLLSSSSAAAAAAGTGSSTTPSNFYQNSNSSSSASSPLPTNQSPYNNYMLAAAGTGGAGDASGGGYSSISSNHNHLSLLPHHFHNNNLLSHHHGPQYHHHQQQQHQQYFGSSPYQQQQQHPPLMKMADFKQQQQHAAASLLVPPSSASSSSNSATTTATMPPPSQSNSDASEVYHAVYSGVPVYEMMCKNVAVMRRRSDSYLNATQILKVAGIDKGKRTKILEKEILLGAHEKVQGGYGKYQGTWIPFERGLQLAQKHNVDGFLKRILECDRPIVGSSNRNGTTLSSSSSSTGAYGAALGTTNRANSYPSSSTSATAARNLQHFQYQQQQQQQQQNFFNNSQQQNFHQQISSGSSAEYTLESSGAMPGGLVGSSGGVGGDGFGGGDGSAIKRGRRPNNNSSGVAVGALNTANMSIKRQRMSNDFDTSYNNHSNRIMFTGAAASTKEPMRSSNAGAYYSNNTSSSTTPGGFMLSSDPDVGSERHRAALMSIFVNEDVGYIPEILASSNGAPGAPNDLNVDLILDEFGHTALGWAASQARVPVMRRLIEKQADVMHRNVNGETALMRAVLETANFENQSMPQVLAMLRRSVWCVDMKHRTVLHHIAAMAGERGKAQCARYYMECVLELIARMSPNTVNVISTSSTGASEVHEMFAMDGFARIVNVQDKNGDTALNIASRIGNRNLVEQLLDVGADHHIENKAGLRPCDFGIDAFSIVHGPNSRTLELDSLHHTATVSGGEIDLFEASNPFEGVELSTSSKTSSATAPTGISSVTSSKFFNKQDSVTSKSSSGSIINSNSTFPPSNGSHSSATSLQQQQQLQHLSMTNGKSQHNFSIMNNTINNLASMMTAVTSTSTNIGCGIPSSTSSGVPSSASTTANSPSAHSNQLLSSSSSSAAGTGLMTLAKPNLPSYSARVVFPSMDGNTAASSVAAIMAAAASAATTTPFSSSASSSSSSNTSGSGLVGTDLAAAATTQSSSSAAVDGIIPRVIVTDLTASCGDIDGLYINQNLKKRGKEITDALGKMMHTMTADYTSELQAKAEALKDTQTSLRALTRELSQARRTNAVLKAQNEKMPDLLLRIQSLESSLGLVGSLSSSSAAADDVSAEATNGSLMVIDSTLVTMGSSSSTATTTSTDDGETETKDGNQKNTMNNIDISQLSESEQITHLTQQIQQLRRLASTSHAALVAHRATDLKYKKIIATCANVPVSGVDGIVDVLLAALESDNDVHVNVPELAGFMARVRTAEVDINNNGGGGVGAVDEGNGA